jgi:hypothetical protein
MMPVAPMMKKDLLAQYALLEKLEKTRGFFWTRKPSDFSEVHTGCMWMEEFSKLPVYEYAEDETPFTPIPNEAKTLPLFIRTQMGIIRRGRETFLFDNSGNSYPRYLTRILDR